MVHTVTYPDSTAFLNISCGGVGLRAGAVYDGRYQADNRPFPHAAVHIDTDPNTAAHVQFPIGIGLSGDKLDAMRADPERFGPEASAILRNFARYLDPEDVGNGSRTIRPLTQLAFAFHEESIARSLRQALHYVVENHRIHHLIPFLTSSSGGGAGSALQILLVRKLREPAFRNLLTEGLSRHLLQRPICFVADPYALAQRHPSPHHSKILGNAFAHRIESEWLERQNATKYFFHIGFANEFGTILSDPEQIGWVLGTCLYEFQRNWAELKARFVDGPDVAALGNGYIGRDLPERFFPDLFNSDSDKDSDPDKGGTP